MNLDEVFEKAKYEVLKMVQAASPYKTGTLSKSFHLVEYDDGFGVRTEIPYMVYTENAWTYNSRWDKTLKNPNEGWFRKVAILILEYMTALMGGEISVIY